MVASVGEIATNPPERPVSLLGAKNTQSLSADNGGHQEGGAIGLVNVGTGVADNAGANTCCHFGMSFMGTTITPESHDSEGPGTMPPLLS